MAVQSDTASLRNLVSFAILWLLNNVVFAVSNASAGNLLPNAIGLVFVINTAPGLLVKLLAPLWVDLGSYDTKFIVVGCCLAFNLVLILTPTPTWLKLVGVAVGDAGSSAGEASCMAMSQFYVQPQRHIAFFALGTGWSGVGGYLLKMFVLPAAGSAGSLIIGAALVIAYWFTFFAAMDAPWVDAEHRGESGGTRYAIMEDDTVDSVAVDAAPKLNSTDGSVASASVSAPQISRRSMLSVSTDSLGSRPARISPQRRIPHRSPLAVSADSLPQSLQRPLSTARATARRMRLKSRELLGASESSFEAFSSASEIKRSESVRRGRDGAKATGFLARMRIFRRLSPYLLPLFCVFWAEYACQSGAWTAFALPSGPAQLESSEERVRAFQFYNLMYQVGVLISRASGLVVVVPRGPLNALVLLQVALLVAFAGDAAMQLFTGWGLGAPALVVGLIGGTLYVQMFLAIDQEVAAEHREAALATCTCGDTAGVLTGEFTGWLMQRCLFDRLELSRGECPWTVTSLLELGAWS